MPVLSATEFVFAAGYVFALAACIAFVLAAVLPPSGRS